VLQSGMTLAPRGIGTLFAMFFAGRLVGRIDARLLLLMGFVLSAGGVGLLAGMSLDADSRIIIVSGVLQGLGMGLLFVPLSTIAFRTVAPHLRTDASGLFTLVRNIGSAVGISIVNAVQLNVTTVVRSGLVEQIRPDNPTMLNLPAGLNPASEAGLARLDGMISRQAAMVAYDDVFYMTAILCLFCIPLLLFLRSSRQAQPGPKKDAHHTVME
jgi:DHA2 family multidrug resistance protein